MTRKIGSISVDRALDRDNEVVHALERAGFVIVLDTHSNTNLFSQYTIAKYYEERTDDESR